MLLVVIPIVAQMQILTVRFTTEFHQLQYIDKVVDVCYVGPANSSGGDSHSCNSLNSGPVVACPLCATTDAVVDNVAQFIDGGGRRCGAAATSSSCRS